MSVRVRAWHATDIEPHVEDSPRAAGRRGPTPTWQPPRGAAADSWPRPPETGPPARRRCKNILRLFVVSSPRINQRWLALYEPTCQQRR